MDSFLSKLTDIVDILTEMNRRLDKLDIKLDEMYKKTSVDVQQDIELKTAIKGLINAARKL